MPTALPDLLPLLAEVNQDRSTTASLSELGDAVGLSTWHAQRTFTRLIGESPGRYQARLRLEAAAALLLNTDRGILEIALAVGFGSHESLTRAFGRHFGASPQAYRNRNRREPGDMSDVGLITETGPCIGLFRTSTTSPKERPAMTYEIVRKTVDATPTLHGRCRVEHHDVADALAKILPAVFGYVMETGAPMAGPPYVRIVERSPAFMTLEPGIPLIEERPAPEGRDDIFAGRLPGGEVASTIHTGPYEQLGEAHAAVDRWLTDNDLSPAGSPWEVYLTDPGEVPDPADWQTEIIWPLA